MCLRFASSYSASLLASAFDASVHVFTDITPSWNVSPGQNTPVIRRNARGGRQVDLLSWGLIPSWSGTSRRVPGPFTSLSEAACCSGLFRETLAHRRCLVPAEAYYAWQSDLPAPSGRPFAVARRDGAPLALAGLWDVWWSADGDVTRSFSLMSAPVPSPAATSRLGATMPVILEQRDWAMWLGETDGDPRTLLQPAAEGLLDVWAVSRALNTPSNDGPELLDPVTENRMARSRLEFA